MSDEQRRIWERERPGDSLNVSMSDEISEAASAAVREEMTCDRCGRHHGVVWFAPSDIWNAVMRGGVRANSDEYSFCCPICFMALAEERDVTTSGWLVTPFWDGPVRRAQDVVLLHWRSDAQASALSRETSSPDTRPEAAPESPRRSGGGS